ncbi:FAD-binding domain-containing protein [Aspergillus karnatakaensis]|uniref:FAD-binding domain-containing protein n=1 Tax=Aspergillus karnatakaensis TaxID=1810916 RepID=UPI003CCD6202
MYISARYRFLTLLWLLITNKALAAPRPWPRTPSSDCRCLPTDPCWPSVRQWSALNQTISGRLLRLRPVGAVCHGAEYNEERCAEAMNNTMSTLWRVTQPGALMTQNWETLGDNETCFIGSPRELPCYQGRIPNYAVMAESAADVQAAVRFSTRHNLHVVIRNTGHDGTGRSSGPGSIQINTNRLKSVQFTDEFVPVGGSESLGSAVTAGSGNMAIELLRAARVQGLNLVTGNANTVGALGGFLLGGGCGPLGPLHGMGADNALQFKVVTADGKLVIANDFQNQDLYWALRGGGGGTFGVVVEATVRTFPEVSAVQFELVANLTGENANRSIWEITREIAAILPQLKQADETTSAIMIVAMAPDAAVLASSILFPTTADLQASENRLTGLMQSLDTLGLPYSSQFTAYEKVSSYLTLPASLFGNFGRVEGSALLSQDLFLQDNGTDHIFETLANLDYQPGDTLEYLMAFGGKVSANKDHVDSSLSPSWRETGILITFRRILPPNSTVKNLNPNPMRRIRSIERPSLGAYVNVGAPDIPDSKQAFWGGHYDRLLEIKRKYDPDSLFIVRLGVESDEWDEEGICRV